MKRMVALVLFVAACGGGSKPAPVEPVVVEEKPKPPPPPPPVCVRAGAEMSLIGMVDADANAVKFCVSDGAESNKCYGVDVEAQKYAELDTPPKGQSPVLPQPWHTVRRRAPRLTLPARDHPGRPPPSPHARS